MSGRYNVPRCVEILTQKLLLSYRSFFPKIGWYSVWDISIVQEDVCYIFECDLWSWNCPGKHGVTVVDDDNLLIFFLRVRRLFSYVHFIGFWRSNAGIRGT